MSDNFVPAHRSSKAKTVLADLRIKVKRIFVRKVRIWKLGQVPLWILIALLYSLFYFRDSISISSHTASLSSTPPNYSSKKFKDKFDLKYKTNDKRKVSDRWVGTKVDEPFQIGCVEPEISRNKKTANASLVVLARNKELGGVIRSMSTLERHFNQWFNYPWVFLNDVEFSDKFKRTVKKYTKSKVEFGVIDSDVWDFPLTEDEDDKDKSKSDRHFNYFEFYEYIERQGDRGIMYGSLDSYHKMCRFYSGGFYRHPLVSQYEWYWRVEPDVEFFCDLTYDPFLEMEKKGKKYGFTVIIKELSNTIPNLFRYTKSFIKENNIQVKNAWNLFVQPLNTFDFKGLNDPDFYNQVKNLQDADDLILAIERKVQINHLLKKMKSSTTKKNDKKNDAKQDQDLLKTLISQTSKSAIPKTMGDVFEGEKYNYCHFWSNFEIARVDVWNNPSYNHYFDYLEQSGGFYKERWGDAPVHSLGVGMFMDLNEIHYFRDIGYKHSTIAHCPHNAFDNQLGYGPSENYFKFENAQRIRKEDSHWLNVDKPKKNGVGCRCKCPKRQAEIENTGGSCIEDWISATKHAELKKFDNANRKYSKKLNVKKLFDLITKDYEYQLMLNNGKLTGKYISSAMKAFKETKRLEEEENVKYTSDEFDQRVMELTVTMVNDKKFQLKEDKLLKEAIQ